MQHDNLMVVSGTTVTNLPTLEQIADHLVMVFSTFPFSKLCDVTCAYENGKMVARIDNHPDLLGNLTFKILHGGGNGNGLRYHWRASCGI